jgi:hypothetical protein
MLKDSYADTQYYLRTALVLILGTVSLAAAQTVDTAVIEGTVVIAGSIEPIVGARVTVTAVPPASDPILPVTTDATGRFAIRGVPPGSYTLAAMANGYARREYRGTITLLPRQTLRHPAIAMVPAGAISGRVQNTSGRPLAGALVTLHRRTYSASGNSSLSRVEAAQTNDLGEYRFYWISPGRYFVSARSGGGGILAGDPAGRFEEFASRGINEVADNYSTAFFPGVADEERAVAIDLLPGTDARGIDLTLTRAKGYRISGRVIDSATGQPPAEMQVSGPGGTRFFRNGRGTFEFDNIFPGTYTLRATSGTGTAIIQPFMPQDPSRPSGARLVTVQDADVDVLLELSVPPIIRGRIRVEGELPPSARLGSLRVTLAPGERSLATASNTTAGEDGTFALPGSPEGTLRVTMPNLPPGLYLKEALLDGADALNTFTRFSASGQLELIVSSRGGLLDGVVTDDQRRPLQGIQTVLIPDNLRHRPELFKRVLSDSNGRFNISGIAPGDYQIFAWEDLEDYAYFDPSVLPRFQARGKPVRISESSRQTMDLTVIPSGDPR